MISSPDTTEADAAKREALTLPRWPSAKLGNYGSASLLLCLMESEAFFTVCSFLRDIKQVLASRVFCWSLLVSWGQPLRLASINPRDVLVPWAAVLTAVVQDSDALLGGWVMCLVPLAPKPLPPRRRNFVVVFHCRKPVPFPRDAVLLLKPSHR